MVSPTSTEKAPQQSADVLSATSHKPSRANHYDQHKLCSIQTEPPCRGTVLPEQSLLALSFILCREQAPSASGVDGLDFFLYPVRAAARSTLQSGHPCCCVRQPQTCLLLLSSLTQAIPAGTTQLSSSQLGKLSAWLTKGDTISDLHHALQDSRLLFMWAAAACRVSPSGSPLANSKLQDWVVNSTQAAAAHMKAAAVMGKLESVELGVTTLSSSSIVASVTAAAIDLLSLVAVDFASYEEPLTYDVVKSHARTCAGAKQQLRKQGGGLFAPPPLTVCSGEKRRKLPKEVCAVFADVDVRKALGHTLLVFYCSQLQQHLSREHQLGLQLLDEAQVLVGKRQEQQEKEQQQLAELQQLQDEAQQLQDEAQQLLTLLQAHEQQQKPKICSEYAVSQPGQQQQQQQHVVFDAAAARDAACRECGVSSSWEEAEDLLLVGAKRLQGPAAAAGSSWEEAEGLLLLGADRLQEQPAIAALNQQVKAVVAGWHRQLQQYRQALGYTEQQLEAAAALLANAGRNSSSSASSSTTTSSSSRSELISVRDCLKYLAAAAVCLPCAPLLSQNSLAVLSHNLQHFPSLHDVLPHAPASLLSSASAAVELWVSQQAMPLVSHFVWWASYAQTEFYLLLAGFTAKDQPQQSALANLQLQRCCWVKFNGEPAQLSSLRLQYADVTASIAGLLTQRLLQPSGALVGPGHRHEPPAAAATWGKHGPAAIQSSHLLRELFMGSMKGLSASGLVFTPALFAHAAAAVQVSEATMRLQAISTVVMPAAQAGSTAGQQEQRRDFLEAVVLPVTALQLLCRAPQELCQSVAGQQLLQSAVSAILTAVKLQGSGRLRAELLTGDVAACMVVVCEALNTVVCHLSAGCLGEVFTHPQHKKQHSKHTRGQSSAGSFRPQAPKHVSFTVAAEALQLVLQLFARCLHLFGSHLQALYEADAAAAAAWLSEQHAELKIVEQALQGSEQSQGGLLELGGPVSNLTGIMSCVAVFSNSVKNGAWHQLLVGAGDEAMQSSGLSSTPHAADSEEAAGSSSNYSSSKQALMLQVLSDLLSEVKDHCNTLQFAYRSLDKVLQHWQQQRQHWQQQQQQQRPMPRGRKAQPRAGFPQEPELSSSADYRVKTLAQLLTSFADKICYVLPGRFCCSHPGCSSLGSVSEGHALVRGQAAICGKCQEAR